MSVIFTFYRNFIWFANFISLFGCYLLWVYGSWAYMIAVFWVKVSTNTVLGLYIHIFNADQYYFFNNLGFRKTELYVFTFLLDLSIWLMLSLITVKFIL